ncbi:MAG: hypothetical protein ACE5KE_09960 [Methanosarcinales archaeon]
MHELIEDYTTPRPLTGKIFWLTIPQNKKINIIKLSERLRGHSRLNEITREENIIIPDVFVLNGKVASTTIIEETTIIENKLIYGHIILDEPYQIEYRYKSILILRTKDSTFTIFQYDKNKKYYLLIFGRRSLFLKDVGIALNPCEIEQNLMYKIREELNADLIY